MSNLCDMIEQYILRLLESSGSVVELQRKAIAKEFGCVPSQVTYVLETRFTVERGYIVESRRGGGGRIRIMRVRSDRSQGVLLEWYGVIGACLSRSSALHWIDRLAWEGLIDYREAVMLRSAIDSCEELGDESLAGPARAALLRGVLKGLASIGGAQ
ncbi:MAG: CtsR family transcriptional regulator [Bacillota bacterium]